MAKTTKKRTVKSRAKRVTKTVDTSLLSTSSNGPWGKDQPMILILSAAIIIMIVLSLFMTGWL
jgi:hypothetical protein